MAKKQVKKLLPENVYETFRWLTWIVLPAIATLIAGLNEVWNWNLPIDAILTSFVSVETFIGTVLGIAKITTDKSR